MYASQAFYSDNRKKKMNKPDPRTEGSLPTLTPNLFVHSSSITRIESQRIQPVFSEYLLSFTPKPVPPKYITATLVFLRQGIHRITVVRVRCYLDLPSLGEIAVKRGLSRSLYKNWKPKLLFKYSISTSSACDVLFYLHEKKRI